MVVGLWESLPLRTLERRLLERNIADPATIKVNISDRKIVEIDICECAQIRMKDGYFSQMWNAFLKTPMSYVKHEELEIAGTVIVFDLTLYDECESGECRTNKQDTGGHIFQWPPIQVFLPDVSLIRVPFDPIFHHVEIIGIIGIAACISLTEVTRLGINFKYFERLPLATFDEVS